MKIQPIIPEYRAAVNQILQDAWACPPCVSRGKKHDTTISPGFISLSCDNTDGGKTKSEKVNGVITINISARECEITTLISLEENKGIATALIAEAEAAAKKAGCTRLWLITTNDNTAAIRFYQRKGFELAAVHINAMETSRKIKPTIPLLGMDNIPIKHEVEFEKFISSG